MTVELTPNAVVAIIGGNVDLKPVLQVTDINPIRPTGLPVCYRLMVSDGVWSHHAMVAFQLNDLFGTDFGTDQVRKGSVVRFTDYICTNVQDRKLIVVMNMETIVLDWELIGNPKQYVKSGTTAQTALPKNNFQQSAYGNIHMIGQEPVSKCQNPRPSFHPENSVSSMPNVRPTFQSESSSDSVPNPRPTFHPESSAPSRDGTRKLN
ncbi:replication protein A 70 kDa DNA-binding subunit A-like [Rosa rugosa]|uniref:replication protein A 70 kDa DNA-binding subunit A-like n=1 Tax=Rosa rugosa TaxID=74645 RepID=UPI002B414B6A|nr:replication protein A 70 kDa DNA-binding subunit A-like [Rosa rugosa]